VLNSDVKGTAIERVGLVRMWSETTARWIFPTRQIERLKPGYEASFLVLERDPTNDIDALRDIRLRVKQVATSWRLPNDRGSSCSWSRRREGVFALADGLPVTLRFRRCLGPDSHSRTAYY
jgi:hypothetical protein